MTFLQTTMATLESDRKALMDKRDQLNQDPLHPTGHLLTSDIRKLSAKLYYYDTQRLRTNSYIARIREQDTKTVDAAGELDLDPNQPQTRVETRGGNEDAMDMAAMEIAVDIEENSISSSGPSTETSRLSSPLPSPLPSL
jgi:hypothetical protein